jgi:S1-C subfamily serine protease
MLLSVPALNAPALAVGSYDSIEEGDEIYLGGFPLAIEQPVVARGLFSTKWRAPAHLIQGPERNVAWLDITMNRGNSGGPIIRMAVQEADDKVVGIASFGLNPFAADMERVIQIAGSFPGGVALMGIPMGPFFTTVGHALATNSLGVSGCVSIEYARHTLPQSEA